MELWVQWPLDSGTQVVELRHSENSQGTYNANRMHSEIKGEKAKWSAVIQKGQVIFGCFFDKLNMLIEY